MELKIDIYSGNAVEKTYTTDDYHLKMGTIEDFFEIIDPDKATDEAAVFGMIAKGFSKLRPLILDVFPDMTDEDFRKIRLEDIIPLVIGILKSVPGMIKNINRGN